MGDKEQTALEKIKEFVFLAPIIGGVIYFYGYLYVEISIKNGMIVKEFSIDEPNIQVIMMQGFAALLIAYSVIAFIYANILNSIIMVNKLYGNRRISFRELNRQFYEKHILKTDLLTRVMFSCLLIFAPILPILWMGSMDLGIANRNSPIVKSILLTSDSKIVTNYKGLKYIKKNGSSYILTDDLSSPKRTIFILNEDEVKEIILSRE